MALCFVGCWWSVGLPGSECAVHLGLLESVLPLLPTLYTSRPGVLQSSAARPGSHDFVFLPTHSAYLLKIQIGQQISGLGSLSHNSSAAASALSPNASLGPSLVPLLFSPSRLGTWFQASNGPQLQTLSNPNATSVCCLFWFACEVEYCRGR